MFTWYAWRAGSPACSSCSRKTGNSPYGEQEGEEFLLTGTIVQNKRKKYLILLALQFQQCLAYLPVQRVLVRQPAQLVRLDRIFQIVPVYQVSHLYHLALEFQEDRVTLVVRLCHFGRLLHLVRPCRLDQVSLCKNINILKTDFLNSYLQQPTY